MKWLNEIDRKNKLTAMLIVVMVVTIYVLLKVADNLGDILTDLKEGFFWTSRLLRPVFIGFVAAYLLYPVMRKIQSFLERFKLFKGHPRRSRGLSVTIIALMIAGIIALAISALISAIKSTVAIISTEGIISSFNKASDNFIDLANDLSSRLESMNVKSDEVNDWIDQAGDTATDFLLSLADGLVDFVKAIPNIFTTLLFSIVFAVYFLMDGENLMNYWKSLLNRLLGPKKYAFVKQIVRDADTVFSGYIRGQVIDATFMAFSTSIALSIVGIKYAILIGLVTGIGNLIPYLGPFLGYGSILIVGLITADYKIMFIAILVLFVIQTVDGNVINPKLLGDAIEVHPLLVIVSLIIGARVGGILGMLFAVPVGALIKLWVERIADHVDKKRRERDKALLNAPTTKKVN